MPKGFMKKIKRESDISVFKMRYNTIYEDYMLLTKIFAEKANLNADEIARYFQVEMRGFYNIITLIHNDVNGETHTYEVVNIFTAKKHDSDLNYLFFFDINNSTFFIAPYYNFDEKEYIAARVRDAADRSMVRNAITGTIHYNGLLTSFDMEKGIETIGKEQIINILMYYSINNWMKAINSLENDLLLQGDDQLFLKKISNKPTFSEMIEFLRQIQQIVSDRNQIQESIFALFYLIDALS